MSAAQRHRHFWRPLARHIASRDQTVNAWTLEVILDLTSVLDRTVGDNCKADDDRTVADLVNVAEAVLIEPPSGGPPLRTLRGP